VTASTIRQRDWLGVLAVAGLLALTLGQRPMLFVIGCTLLAVFAREHILRIFPNYSAPNRRVALVAMKAMPWILVAGGSTWMLLSAPLAQDDLLRHVHGKAWNYDYGPHFGHHIFSNPWSFWFGFDWVVGTIHELTGEVLQTTRVVRAMIFAIVGTGVVLAIRRVHQDPVVCVGATLAILFNFLWLRLNLGRPEVLYTGLTLAAVALPRGVWLACFVALVPAYWLSPIYAAGALLLGSSHEPWRERLVRNAGMAAMALAAAIAFWWFHTNGTLFDSVLLLDKIVTIHKDEKIPVGEMLPLALSARDPAILVLLFLMVIAAWRYGHAASAAARRDVVLMLTLAALFALPDYVRYAGLIVSLLSLALLRLCSDLSTPSHWFPGALAASAVLVVLLVRPVSDGASKEVLKHLTLPAGSEILASFNSSSFYATAANPNSIVTPLFDINGMKPGARQLVIDLTMGKLDCAAMRAVGQFDYLVESSLEGAAPPCLQIMVIDGPQRLWRVLTKDN
jgi:hypothetical protein